MKLIKEKIAYLHGYADALKISEATDEGKLLLKMMEVLDDIGDALEGLAEAQNDMQEDIELLDDDLTDLEEFVLDYSEEFDDEDYEDYDYDFDDDDDLYEVICPKCGKVYLSDFESFEENDVICPDCGEKFILDEKVADQLIHGEHCQCEACSADEDSIPF